MPDRPTSREIEGEQQRPGAPPRPSNEPHGAKASQQSDRTWTDPGSGETLQGEQAPKESAAGERAPAAHEDRRAKPD